MINKVIRQGKIRQDFIRKNYTRVSLSVTNKELEEASMCFINFLNLPYLIKEKFSALADKNDRGSESGYVHRRKIGGYDDKEYFNYRGITETLLQRSYMQYSNRKEVLLFTRKAKAIYSKIEKDVRKILLLLEKEYSGIHKKVFNNKKRSMCLRFIRYNLENKNLDLAKAHYDRGFATLTLYENTSGLMVGKNDKTLRRIPRIKGTGIFMPSFTFSRDTGDATILPAWHVVKNTQKTRERIAIVFFLDTYSDNSISYNDTHTVKT